MSTTKDIAEQIRKALEDITPDDRVKVMFTEKDLEPLVGRLTTLNHTELRIKTDKCIHRGEFAPYKLIESISVNDENVYQRKDKQNYKSILD